ncbi:MAG: AraC family transcriptional regulator [Clostridia bacterium]|nr:AraC family transcriptional regulator [Clostridia bacterium]
MEKKYYKHKIENLLVISKIITIHYFEFDKSFVSHTESHDFWELVYADKGDLICYTDGNEVLLKEGEVIFHKPGVSHAHRADGKRAPNVFIVSFECKSEAVSFFENRRMRVSKNLLNFIFSIIDESKKTFDLPYSDPELKKMKLLPSPTLGGQQLIKNYLELLLINLMRDETEKDTSGAIFLPREQFDERISGQVTAYMMEHINERLTVSDICEALHYNKSYVFKQFKKTANCSMMAYFTKLKIERAKQLLRETNLSISHISETLSFDNANYFSKTFKKITGYTPSTYRKMRRGTK